MAANGSNVLLVVSGLEALSSWWGTGSRAAKRSIVEVEAAGAGWEVKRSIIVETAGAGLEANRSTLVCTKESYLIN